MSKLLTVFGATGKQGNSVIQRVLTHPTCSKTFKIRGVTRDPSKLASKKLESQGVEMVKGDLLDKESLRTALKGSHAVFAVTDYWATMSKDTEVTQGKNVADVSKEANIQHLVWSNLPHVTKLTNGKYPHVAHFDGKAEIGEYIQSIGVPYTFFMPGFFFSNLKSAMKRDAESGAYKMAFPTPGDLPYPYLESEVDTGKFVAAILANRERLLGKTVQGTSGWYTQQQVVEAFTEVTGKKAEYVELPAEGWKSFLPETIAQEMLENMLLISPPYHYYGGDDPMGKDWKESTAILDEPLTTLEEAIKNQGPWA